MRLAFLFAFCISTTACVKTDLEPLPRVTRADVIPYGSDTYLFAPYRESQMVPEVPAMVNFIDGERTGWTRTFVFEFGMPRPVLRTDLYDGDRYLGYFAVGAGVLPGSHAVFEVRRGKILARKRVSKGKANRFLDLLGRKGELE